MKNRPLRWESVVRDVENNVRRGNYEEAESLLINFVNVIKEGHVEIESERKARLELHEKLLGQVRQLIKKEIIPTRVDWEKVEEDINRILDKYNLQAYTRVDIDRYFVTFSPFEPYEPYEEYTSAPKNIVFTSIHS